MYDAPTLVLSGSAADAGSPLLEHLRARREYRDGRWVTAGCGACLDVAELLVLERAGRTDLALNTDERVIFLDGDSSNIRLINLRLAAAGEWHTAIAASEMARLRLRLGREPELADWVQAADLPPAESFIEAMTGVAFVVAPSEWWDRAVAAAWDILTSHAMRTVPQGREARDREMLVRYMGGHLPIDIARPMGISSERVRQLLRALGAPARQTQINQREQAFATSICEECGVRTMAHSGARSAFCSEACRSAARAPESRRRWRGKDGHWWCHCPFSQRNVRYERYLMARHLGRRLERGEYVTLEDGNPDHLDMANLVMHGTRTWDREAVEAALLSHYGEHGDLPNSYDLQKNPDLPFAKTVLLHIGGGASWPAAMRTMATRHSLASARYGRRKRRSALEVVK